MSNLKNLIAQFCPHGVEFKKLGEVAEYKNIKNKDQKCKLAYSITKIGLIPTEEYFKDSKTKITSDNTSGYKIVKKNWFVYSPSRIDVGSINFLKDAEEVIVSPLDVVFSVDETKILPTFLLYYLLSHDGMFQILNVRHGIEGTGRKLLPFEDFARIKIPVPPLPVQAEIVRILDTFTELISLLTEELKLRKKQYEYYRDKLLTFDNVPIVKLGEIGKVSMCKRIMKNETSESGEIPFYKIGTFGKTADAFISRELFEKYKANYSYPKKGDILISAAGTIGRTVIFDGEPAYFQDSNIVWVANDETQVLNKFLYYWYQKNNWQISKGGTIARLYNDGIANAKIPVPPIEEQERIVAILDKFDKLCNDLREGIPAEIALRQKQYEYYRDKLLTFTELKI